MSHARSGIQARSIRAGMLAALIGLAALLFSAAPAGAAVIHRFERELTGFNDPQALAVAANGDLYVADSTAPDHRATLLKRLNAEGQPVDFSCGKACEAYVSEGGEGDQLLTGTPTEGGGIGLLGVAVDAATGDIYVASERVVNVFGEDGEYLDQIKGTCPMAGSCGAGEVIPFARATGVSLDQATGELYVVDSERGVVDVFNQAGEYVRQFGAGVLAKEASEVPIAVDEFSEEVYVGNHIGEFQEVVDVFGPSGSLLARWTGAETPAEVFGNEMSLAVDQASGRVYVAGTAIFGEVGETAVDEFEPSSLGGEVFIGQITGTASGPFAELAAVAVAPSAPRDVFVADHAARVVDVFGEDLAVPEATVSAPSDLLTGSATLNGSLNADGGGPATCRFEYGTSLFYGSEIDCVGPGSAGSPVNGSSPVSVSAPIEGLAPDVTYHFRLDGTNANGTNTGLGRADRGSFTTPGPGVRGEWASAVASRAAVLRASIDPNNGRESVSHGAVESYYFEYSSGPVGGCESSSCVTAPAAPGVSLGEGEAPVEVDQPLSGLSPGSVYHYRVVAVYHPASGPVEEFPFAEQTFTTQPATYPALLDDRGWELVSPPDKHGGLIVAEYEPTGYGPRGYKFQAAANGEAVTYLANAPTEAVAEGNANVSQVLSVRLPGGGWQSRDLNPPHAAATRLSVGKGAEYRAFSINLTTALLQPQGPFTPAISPAASEQTAFLRADYTPGAQSVFCTESCYRPIITGCPASGSCPAAVAALADVPPGSEFGGEKPCISAFICGPEAGIATPDLSHILFGFSGPSPAEGLYEFSSEAPPNEALKLVSVLPAGEVSGAEGSGALGISADGSRVFWQNGHRFYMRDTATGQTLLLYDGTGASIFANTFVFVASSDGSRAVFVESEKLWECRIVQAAGGELECQLTEIAGGVLKQSATVLGASEDLSYLYFASTEAIAGAGANQAGQEAQPGQPNIYLYHEGAYTFIATAHIYRGYTGESQIAHVSPDGHWLAFSTEDSLTGYENTGPHCVQAGGSNPVPDDFEAGVCQEVYLYHAGEAGGPGSLHCASCNPTGELPAGPSTLPVVQSAYLDDSGRLFFNSSDALVSADSDGVQDVYEYEPPGAGSCEEGSVAFSVRDGGCIGLVSSGRSDQDSEYIGASTNGDDVFFRTSARLTPADIDSYPDIYDARVGGGEAQAPRPVECLGDACQQPASAPEDPTPASLSYHGPEEKAPAHTEKQVTVKTKKSKHKKHERKSKAKRERMRRTRSRGRRSPRAPQPRAGRRK